ncbi:Blue-light-activated histidine kinase [Methylobacterium soli]|nr:Blue-light-activated histidine kinase [Methylobacterium soli]
MDERRWFHGACRGAAPSPSRSCPHTSHRPTIGPDGIDFRILHGDLLWWVSARGRGDDKAIVGRTLFGIFLDVTGRKQAEAGHALLAGEMRHRAENLLTGATSLTAITSRSTNTTVDMAYELTQRLGALGRAHDLVRPLPGHEGKAALLGGLVAILLRPYDDLGAFSGRIRVCVPRMSVGEAAAATLASDIHERATNSMKDGASSVPTGTLDVSGTDQEETLVLARTERGGPAVTQPTGPGGYGRRLPERAITRQPNRPVTRSWDEAGIVVNLTRSKAYFVG